MTPCGGRIVTITTVGYGDYFPVTTLGRMTAVFVMFAGIGIIGALASILASLLVTRAEGRRRRDDAPSGGAGTTAAAARSDDVARELALLRAEVAELREPTIARAGRAAPWPRSGAASRSSGGRTDLNGGTAAGRRRSSARPR